LSTLPRISPFLAPAVVAAALAACSPEQSKAIGNQPKKTVDSVTNNLNQSLQQGADRTRQEDARQDAK